MTNLLTFHLAHWQNVFLTTFRHLSTIWSFFGGVSRSSLGDLRDSERIARIIQALLRYLTICLGRTRHKRETLPRLLPRTNFIIHLMAPFVAGTFLLVTVRSTWETCCGKIEIAWMWMKKQISNLIVYFGTHFRVPKNSTSWFCYNRLRGWMSYYESQCVSFYESY